MIGLQARSRTNPPFDFRRLMLQYPQSYGYTGVGETDFTQGIPPYVLGGGTPAFDDSKLSKIGVPISMAPFSPDIKDSMAQTWNLTFERQLPSKIGLRLSYVGTKGSNLQIIEPINTAAPASTMPGVSTQNRRTNPIYGDIATLQTYGFSNSHQFQAEVRRNMSRGLTMQAFYAWNRTLANTEYSAGSSAPTTILGDRASGIAGRDDRIRAEYASSSGYPLHQFTMNFLWDLPFGPNQRWAVSNNALVSRLLGGWQLAANAGMRSGMFMSYATRNATRWQTGDPNLPRSEQTVARYFDASVFVPATDSNGKAIDYYVVGKRPGRNNIEGPGFKNMDLSLFKNTPIHERLNLRITLDAFNVFNHPSWGQPNATTGRITSMASSPRLLQFGARLEF